MALNVKVSSIHRPIEENYPPWESKGRRLREWMNGPTDSECSIPQTSLMFSDLKEPFWTLDITPESLPAKERALICRARLLNQIFRGASESDDRRAVYKSVNVYNSPKIDDHHIFEWEGFIGPVMLTI